MISFTDFAGRLARGQLKNMAAVDDTNLGEINPDYLDTILSLTNQGLVDLSTRLPLITKQIDLTLTTGQYVYAFLDINNPGYLSTDVTGDAFAEEQFIKILDIFDGNGTRHSVNTQGHIMSPTYNTLRFTGAKIKEFQRINPQVRIRYQAKHLGILVTDSIDIPPNLITALQLFVASLYISHMNSKDHSQRGDKYFSAYLRHLHEDEIRDTSSTSEVDDDSRFISRGFI